jgi:hypothetical protein
VPFDLCWPDEHPEEEGASGIGIGDGLVYTGADGDLEVHIYPQSTLAYISIIFGF